MLHVLYKTMRYLYSKPHSSLLARPNGCSSYSLPTLIARLSVPAVYATASPLLTPLAVAITKAYSVKGAQVVRRGRMGRVHRSEAKTLDAVCYTCKTASGRQHLTDTAREQLTKRHGETPDLERCFPYSRFRSQAFLVSPWVRFAEKFVRVNAYP
jgi:hypothetical protein